AHEGRRGPRGLSRGLGDGARLQLGDVGWSSVGFAHEFAQRFSVAGPAFLKTLCRATPAPSRTTVVNRRAICKTSPVRGQQAHQGKPERGFRYFASGGGGSRNTPAPPKNLVRPRPLGYVAPFSARGNPKRRRPSRRPGAYGTAPSSVPAGFDHRPFRPGLKVGHEGAHDEAVPHRGLRPGKKHSALRVVCPGALRLSGTPRECFR